MDQTKFKSQRSDNIFADLIAAVVTQATSSSTDEAHNVRQTGQCDAFCGQKARTVFYGPYNVKFEKEQQ